MIPKADLHVHLEGTITPAMVMRLSERNKISIPPDLIRDGKFYWKGDGTGAGELLGFLKAYDAATSVMRGANDYADITYDYLKRAADEGCIYSEITISADHGAMCGLSYPEMLDAIAKGYERAKKETGIEARLIATAVRHYGVESCMKTAELARHYPHPLVTGFGIAGDENAGTFQKFAQSFILSGLKNWTAHAGEAAGPASIRSARKVLKNRRFGHMVRAIEDADLMQELVAIKAVPEVCVSSNLVLKVFKDYKSHPLRRFFDAGLKVTFGSDDPTFFGTSIGREYQIAKDHFGFTDTELRQVTRNAIEEAFVDEATRSKLRLKI